MNSLRLSGLEALDLLSPPRKGVEGCVPDPTAHNLSPSEGTFCNTGFWSCPERAHEFWQSCLQPENRPLADPAVAPAAWTSGAIERFVACGRLLQFRDLPGGALGWSWLAWFNGAAAALAGMPLADALALTAPYADFDRAQAFYTIVTRPGLVPPHELQQNTKLLRRLESALREVDMAQFESLEQFVATAALAGWLAIEDGHLVTPLVLDTWSSKHPIAIAHLRLLACEADGLSAQERSHPLARFWAAYYTGDPHRTHIPRVALLSIAKARKHAWSLREFLLDAFTQAHELTAQDPKLATWLIGALPPDDVDVRAFEHYAGRSILDIDRDSIWQALPGVLAYEYPNVVSEYLPIEGVEVLRGAYTYAFFWGLISEKLRNTPPTKALPTLKLPPPRSAEAPPTSETAPPSPVTAPPSPVTAPPSSITPPPTPAEASPPPETALPRVKMGFRGMKTAFSLWQTANCPFPSRRNASPTRRNGVPACRKGEPGRPRDGCAYRKNKF